MARAQNRRKNKQTAIIIIYDNKVQHKTCKFCFGAVLLIILHFSPAIFEIWPVFGCQQAPYFGPLFEFGANTAKALLVSRLQSWMQTSMM